MLPVTRFTRGGVRRVSTPTGTARIQSWRDAAASDQRSCKRCLTLCAIGPFRRQPILLGTTRVVAVTNRSREGKRVKRSAGQSAVHTPERLNRRIGVNATNVGIGTDDDLASWNDSVTKKFIFDLKNCAENVLQPYQTYRHGLRGLCWRCGRPADNQLRF